MKVVIAYGLVAFITRNRATDSAQVEIREKTTLNASGEWRLGDMLEDYETANAGAAASARRSMKKLAQAKAAA